MNQPWIYMCSPSRSPLPPPSPPDPSGSSGGEGEGGMLWENSIETCILSRVKQITSPGWMHETSARGWCTDLFFYSFFLNECLLKVCPHSIFFFFLSSTSSLAWMRAISIMTIPHSLIAGIFPYQPTVNWKSLIHHLPRPCKRQHLPQQLF